MRVFGIDYGDSRVGTAITDELGITAQGLETILNDGKDKKVLARLEEIINKYQVSIIVIGMPINMDGSNTERAQKSVGFIHKLKCNFNKIPIKAVDERLTTVQAHRTMNELGIKSKNKTNLEDTISAVYILETYINNEKNNK